MTENQIQLFNNPEFGGVRGCEEPDGTVWVVAKDVAAALEYSSTNMTQIFSHVPDTWKGSKQIATPGGKQEMLILTEQGLYFFLARSDKPKALPFQMWLANDVVPAIRKTGSYSMELPQTYAAALRALADKAEALVAAHEELACTQDMLDVVTEQRNEAQLELANRNAARTRREIARKAQQGAPCKYNVRVFTHPMFGTIRTAIYNGKPHFVVGDLIAALESPTKVWTRKKDIVGEGIVPEEGVIPYVRGANPPEAAEFCRWLLLEVLPILHQTKQ